VNIPSSNSMKEEKKGVGDVAMGAGEGDVLWKLLVI
jgi:hypothetical protein